MRRPARSADTCATDYAPPLLDSLGIVSPILIANSPRASTIRWFSSSTASTPYALARTLPQSYSRAQFPGPCRKRNVARCTFRREIVAQSAYGLRCVRHRIAYAVAASAQRHLFARHPWTPRFAYILWNASRINSTPQRLPCG
jgi:hypothetical protein